MTLDGEKFVVDAPESTSCLDHRHIYSVYVHWILLQCQSQGHARCNGYGIGGRPHTM